MIQYLLSCIQRICLLLFSLNIEATMTSSSAAPPSSCLATSSHHGCNLLLPKDIQFNAEIKSALSILREDKDQDQEHVTKTTSSEDAKENPSIKERRRLQESALNQLKSMGVWNDDGVTLTFIGYKGRKKEDQINQDRSFVLSP